MTTPRRTLAFLSQAGKLGVYYFLSTSLIIFPTAAGGALLGMFGSIRYLRHRKTVGTFDAAPVRISQSAHQIIVKAHNRSLLA